MTKKVSFTALEKEITPEFREKINHAEGVIDLENFYSRTMVKLLDVALEGAVKLMPDDVQLDPEAACGYELSNKLRNHPAFRERAANSDLETILERFASAVKSRYRHFRKHPERPISKVRN